MPLSSQTPGRNPDSDQTSIYEVQRELERQATGKSQLHCARSGVEMSGRSPTVTCLIMDILCLA